MVAKRSDELSHLRLCQLRFAVPRLSSMRESQTYRPACAEELCRASSALSLYSSEKPDSYGLLYVLYILFCYFQQ